MHQVGRGNEERNLLAKDSSSEIHENRVNAREPELLKLGSKGVLIDRLETLREEVERVYDYIGENYRNDGNALLQASEFFHHYRNNLYMEMKTLSMCQSATQALDIQFAVYQRLRQIREGKSQSSHANGGSMTAVDRVLFDQKWKNATSHETTVFQVIYQIWQRLMSSCPDFDVLQDYAEKLAESMKGAERHYEECLKLNSESSRVLRAYGQFLGRIKGDYDKSNEYLNKADRVEEASGKNKQFKVEHVCIEGRASGKASYETLTR